MLNWFSRKKTPPYVPPEILKKWVNDIPNGEFYEAFIQADKTVWSACGRYAHSSGSTSSSWEEFQQGSLDSLIEKTMGPQVLKEMHAFLSELSA